MTAFIISVVNIGIFILLFLNNYNNKKWYVGFLIYLGLILTIVFSKKYAVEEYLEKQKVVIEINDSTIISNAKKEVLFEDSVYEYIKSLNIKHPEVVFKQAKIESGNFKSTVFRENNNMFGMRVPNKRSNTVIGENRGYSIYNSWQESIIDYALYQTYTAKGMSKEQYIRHLNANYAEDPNYDKKVQ